MSEGKDVRDRHGHQLRSMGPPGDDKDDVWSTDVEGAAGLPRISLAGGLPRTPVGGSAGSTGSGAPSVAQGPGFQGNRRDAGSTSGSGADGTTKAEHGTGYVGGVGDERSSGTGCPNLSRITGVRSEPGVAGRNKERIHRHDSTTAGSLFSSSTGGGVADLSSPLIAEFGGVLISLCTLSSTEFWIKSVIFSEGRENSLRSMDTIVTVFIAVA